MATMHRRAVSMHRRMGLQVQPRAAAGRAQREMDRGTEEWTLCGLPLMTKLVELAVISALAVSATAVLFWLLVSILSR
jgi:hypothetical protein